MRKNNCEVIRRELDELNLDEKCSAAVVEHLKECAACSEFHQKQTKLREIVGSLDTVAAPPDFDFRLRARLASEASSASFHLKSAYWPFARRGVTVAAVLLVVATGVVIVRNVMNRPAEIMAVKDQPAVRSYIPIERPTVAVNTPAEVSSGGPGKKRPQKIRSERSTQVTASNKRPVATMDFSFERADVINGSVAASTAFPIDASLQSLKVSLDDGRGNARTISVPTISFGSQRVLQSGNQFSPKGIW